jgi:hypothetical protein
MRTWPPTLLGAWYSSLSSQLIFSGYHVGTVAAKVPPGFSTRTSSPMAATSSWMCSSTSLVMTRSNEPWRRAGGWRRPAARRRNALRDLAGFDHRAERAAGGDHLVGHVVERHDVGAAARDLERVATEAGARVEHEVAGLQAQPVESDGEQALHRAVPLRRRRPFLRSFSTFCGMASTSRY